MQTITHGIVVIQGPIVYSTGEYIQYPVINHNGKEYEKVCMCIIESLYCTAEINTTL